MLESKVIFLVVCIAVAVVGAIGITYQIYQIVLIDARARGLKHPKFWGIFTVCGNNSSGLLMYLIGRRKYPIINLSDYEKQKLNYHKKVTGVGIIFVAVGAIGLTICSFMFL